MARPLLENLLNKGPFKFFFFSKTSLVLAHPLSKCRRGPCTKILAYFLKILHIKFLPRLLFMARANPSLEDSQDRTPIYLAAERGHTQAVDYLADKFKVICKSFVKQ